MSIDTPQGGAPTSRAGRRARNRASLLRAAAEAILERGVEGARLDDIAARAGVTKGAIYSIFGSKSDLIIALLERQMEATRAADTAPADGSTVPDRIRAHAAAIGELLATAETRHEIALEIDLAALAHRDPRVADIVRRLRRERLDGLSRTLGSEPLARALLALEQGWALAVVLDDAPANALIVAADALAHAAEG